MHVTNATRFPIAHRSALPTPEDQTLRHPDRPDSPHDAGRRQLRLAERWLGEVRLARGEIVTTARLLDGLRVRHSLRMQSASKFDEICARIAATDPLIIDAIDDVDLGMLKWSISLTPRERLRAVSSAARTLSGFRRVAPSARRPRNRH